MSNEFVCGNHLFTHHLAMDLRRIHTLGFVLWGLFVLKCKPHNQSLNAKQDSLQRIPFQGKLTLASQGKATFMYDESHFS